MKGSLRILPIQHVKENKNDTVRGQGTLKVFPMYLYK